MKDKNCKTVNKKPVYEAPRIFDLNDYANSRGGTTCTNTGSGATDTCDTGSSAFQCVGTGNAAGSCDVGNGVA
jgi:hypothetical protein